MFKNFVTDCLDAEATLFDLDKYVEYWHTNDVGNTLQEFLGLTDYEFEQWGKSSDAIFRDILYCRKYGFEYQRHTFLTEGQRIAARSYDIEAIEKLKNEDE